MIGTKTALKIAEMPWEKNFVSLSCSFDVPALAVCLALTCNFPTKVRHCGRDGHDYSEVEDLVTYTGDGVCLGTAPQWRDFG